ncbi:uncharacterized protein MEPE_05110 [Melanopsichium pennsylvanicum]|uniref:Uncharacterized protein n=2 Tax=Melanopsichium pennsylvanicum TaxID=63383 RepID=A0AAJ5C702_9BASI|nr:putative protein [Melanopsichium pennsylvanicum 4]SNX86401.1 uncharacterized protein MEPE_05110 [Melanopsichium pennsylvanicum]
MRSTAVRALKVKPLPASAFPSLRLPPSASSIKATSAASSLKPKPTTADVAAELENKIIKGQELGGNVRIAKNVSNKDLYWKVSKPQRDVLKKLLREA